MDSLEFLPLCRSQYIPLAVSITPHTTNLELELKISQEIERRGRHHIYRFRIRGMRDPDVEFDLESLQSRYRISEVTDESEPQYDFSALFAQHPGDMIGFYIRALQKDDMSEVEKRPSTTAFTRCCRRRTNGVRPDRTRMRGVSYEIS